MDEVGQVQRKMKAAAVGLDLSSRRERSMPGCGDLSELRSIAVEWIGSYEEVYGLMLSASEGQTPDIGPALVRAADAKARYIMKHQEIENLQ